MEKTNGSVNRIWYNKPEIWAVEQNRRVKKECSFLDKLFKKYKVQKVLDVGCGVGSHCGYLKKLGYSPVGVDLNKNEIKYAKKQFPEIPFLVVDQKNLKFKNKFDAIYSLNTVIAYTITNENLVKTLQNYYKALHNDGILVIDVFNSIIFIDKKKYLRKRKDRKNILGYYALRKYSVDENKQLSIDKATFYDSETGKIISSDKSVKRMIFPQEIKFFLEQTGFRMLRFYGDFDFSHKKLDGDRMIIVAKKR